MKSLKFAGSLIASALILSTFTGCATTTLQSKAKMTRSVFLDPVKKSERIVFVTVKNTSGHDLNLEEKIVAQLRKKGYKVVDDPDAAKYILMVNVLFADNLKEATAAQAAGAFGGVGAAAGASGGGKDALAGALIGAVVGGVLAKATEDDIFRMVVDVVVREKTKTKVTTTVNHSEGQVSISNKKRAGVLNSFAGPIRSTDEAGQLNDAMHEQKTQYYTTDYIEKKTRVFAEAVKMKLTLDEALPVLEDKIAKSIAGIF